MKRVTLIRSATVAILVSALFVAGCANTVRGVARDLNETGTAIDDSVN
jgi:predicted small secreted protein